MTNVQNELPVAMRGRKMWWLLPLAFLFLLIGVIYLLGHMSSADSEMYPTTQRHYSSVVCAC